MWIVGSVPWIWDWPADAWTAVAAWVTAMIAAGAAVTAGIYAKRQVDYAREQVAEARNTREDQAQPFVAIDFEPSPAAPGLYMDLVIRNLGTTLATNVRFVFDEPLRSTMDDHTELPLREAAILRTGIPTLPPGREYRILFERMDKHYESSLPRSYGVTVLFDDARGRQQDLRYRLDLDIYYEHEQLTVYGEHDSAKALQEIKDVLKKWTRDVHGGLLVYGRDDVKERAEQRAAVEQRRREREAERAAADSREPPKGESL